MALDTFTLAGSAAIAGLVALSAFFSSSETAIFTLSDEWITEQESLGDARIAVLQELRSDPHRLLVTILVGNNVVNMAIASLTTVIVIKFLPAGGAVTVATVLASFIVLVFGEIVPKSYGLGHAREWAPTVAGPISLVERSLYPLVVVFDVVTRRLSAWIGGDVDIEDPYVEE
ncbi:MULTISPECIES: CNNM domain-containing protein [unclassified Haloparvum]|uniref:CNNM domain-containing protein n=1 Tax=Haloparvum sp. PAK95 TaxID=3418962 RepID=UPI003D2F18F8